MRAGIILRMGGGSVTSLTAVAAPASVTGTSPSSPVTSDPSTCTPSGGTGPYTYAWEWVSNPNSLTIVSASAASTTFRKSSAASGLSYGATARCKVTDSLGAIAYSNDVAITVDRT